MSDERDRSVFAFLRILATSSLRQRLAILSTISISQCNILTEAAYNILFNSAIDVQPHKKRRIQKFINIVKKIASKKISQKHKRNFVKLNPYAVKVIADIAYDHLK